MNFKFVFEDGLMDLYPRLDIVGCFWKHPVSSKQTSESRGKFYSTRQNSHNRAYSVKEKIIYGGASFE